MPKSMKPRARAFHDEVDPEKLVLGDRLALDRTVLANERTFLAYVRTALALLVGGASLIHFFDIAWAQITGWCLLPSAPLLLITGLWRYRRVRKHIWNR
jgi:putative membrane protein